MKHLVIVAHPAAGSFTMALARPFTAQVEQLGHSQCIYDLYRMGFNPMLTAEQLSRTTRGHWSKAAANGAGGALRATYISRFSPARLRHILSRNHGRGRRKWRFIAERITNRYPRQSSIHPRGRFSRFSGSINPNPTT